MNKNILVILAAGLGVRFEADVPKQYTMLNGERVIDICIRQMNKSHLADKMIVVVDRLEQVEDLKKLYEMDVIEGGDSRAESFQKAINYVDALYPECEKIIFHEAARPLISHDVIDRYFELLEEFDYVETCKKITDSLGSYSIKAPDRDDFYLIQAPEAYRFQVLKKYFDANSPIYFAANQFPDTCNGFRYFGVACNYKLTTPEDKVIIESLLQCRIEDEKR